MLKTWLNETTIALRDSVDSWPQALALCAQPLLEQQVISPAYVTAIIEQHHALGPYYVLAPGLAMPHARPEEGANGLGLSLLKLNQGVSFGAGEFDPVDVRVMLAAPAKLHQANTLEEIKIIVDRF